MEENKNIQSASVPPRNQKRVAKEQQQQQPEEPAVISELKKEEPFWKRRNKHGRDAIFTSPELLWELACEYFQWCDDNPFYKGEWKDGDLQSIPIKRPYGLGSLCIQLGVGPNYFRDFKKSQTYESNPDFSWVISVIENTIREQKFEGAAAGFFNANIISRDLGLADKQVVDSNVNLSKLDIEFK